MRMKVHAGLLIFGLHYHFIQWSRLMDGSMPCSLYIAIVVGTRLERKFGDIPYYYAIASF